MKSSRVAVRVMLAVLCTCCASSSYAQAIADATQVVLPAETAPPLAARCDEVALSTLLTCTWNDFRHLGARDSLMWLGVGGAIAAGSLSVDNRVADALLDPDPDLPVDIGAQLGEVGVHFGIPVGLYAVSRMAGKPAMAGLSIDLLRAQVVNAIVTRSLKFLPRARPYQGEARLGRGSFPSGHTSSAFTTATVLTRRFGWRAGIPAYAVAGFIGATRLQNMHYLSDVAFGAGLGIASGLTLNVTPARTAITPIVGPGVAGVSVSMTNDRR